jgi:hypothetical protein
MECGRDAKFGERRVVYALEIRYRYSRVFS